MQDRSIDVIQSDKATKIVCNIAKWLLITLAALVCLAIICILFFLLVIIPWQIEHGYHWKGIDRKFHNAMVLGDGKKAIYWATRGYAYKILGKGGGIHNSEQYIGNAYELDSQYEKALRWYAISAVPSNLSDLCYGRIYFKQGKKREAFQQYCRFAEVDLDTYKGNLEDTRTLGKIRKDITLEDNYYFMRLSPFIEYNDFLKFVEQEYENLGSPPECEVAMKLFRDLKKGIVPSSDATPLLQKMKETILKERDTKSNKSSDGIFHGEGEIG